MNTVKEIRQAKLGPAADFLKSLAQAAGVVALYRSSHPVAQKAAEDACGKLQKLLADRSGGTLTAAPRDRGWCVDGSPVPDAGSVPESFSNMLLQGGWSGLTFADGIKTYELAALCELASLAPEQWSGGDGADFFTQRGVKNIRLDAQAPAPAGAPPAAATSPSPSPEAGAAASPRFGDFLRKLVEDSVQDPAQRRDLYEQALGLVRTSLDSHVAAATARFAQEKQAILNEQKRTESVLTTVADGKVIVDKDGRVLMMNPAAEKISGKSLAQLAGKPIVHQLDPAKQMLALAESGAQKARISAREEVQRTISESIATVHDEGGRVIGTFTVLPDALKTEETLRLQQDFVARVSHELKAPLSALCAALELVADKASAKLGPDEREFLDTCRRNSEQLQRMIADILDFSRLEAGQLSVRPAPAPAEPIISEAVAGLKPWAISRGIALDCMPVAPGFPLIMADHQRVVQILNNLASNAIKCTPSGGRVLVGVDAGKKGSEGAALFWVRDTGCGIPKEDQRRMFEKFVQLPGTGGRREGVGLGLTIVVDLVTQHNGKIFVESEVGRGTTMSFTIPAAGTPPAQGKNGRSHK